jgi:phage terminase large subunit
MLRYDKCPRCGAPMVKSKAFNNGESEFWFECTKCNTYVNTYKPQAHQADLHKDNHTFIGNFGGYGSGKTLTDREEFYKHMFITPLGNTLIGANIQPQYEQTIKRDIEADLPLAFFTGWSTQKQHYDFINGHRLMYRPFDDPNKLRSYNVTMFIMLEASEIKAETFTQLKTRARNMAATLPKRDADGNIIYHKARNGVPIPEIQASWIRGIIESNPDSGWIRMDVLEKSSDIQKHGTINDTYAVLENEADQAISSHITATDQNEFLPENFIEQNTKNKPAWWIARYIYGSFSYAEGLVYPSAMRWLEDDFEIPRGWKRCIAYDYGLSDDSVFLFGAIDEAEGILHLYKEIRTKDKSVEELANLFKEGCADIPVGGYAFTPLIDPKSGPKRDYDKKTLADHFLDYGIVFESGHINIDARVFRLNTYFEQGRIRIMKQGCAGLIKELRDYKFKTRTLSNDYYDDKPVDKDNHAINPLEWIVMRLPADPRNLVYGAYTREGKNLNESNPEKDNNAFGIYALSDDNEDDDYVQQIYNPYL